MIIITIKKPSSGISLVVQGIGIRLPMQGTQLQSLVSEDPTCRGATKPVRHNYWAWALEPVSHNYWAHVLQLLKPVCLEPVLHKRSHLKMKPTRCNEDPKQPHTHARTHAHTHTFLKATTAKKPPSLFFSAAQDTNLAASSSPHQAVSVSGIYSPGVLNQVLRLSWEVPGNPRGNFWLPQWLEGVLPAFLGERGPRMCSMSYNAQDSYTKGGIVMPQMALCL